MAFCENCGHELNENAKFCFECGAKVLDQQTRDNTERKMVFEGEVHKCPNCGEPLGSFEINCPACGYELRNKRASSAVKEFALKLEAIEAAREFVKPRGFFASATANEQVSKTDEQKISLIKSFSVPNSKEDMLEFMILATSNINMKAFDSTETNLSKSEKEVSAAWLSKAQQIYEKAKRIYSSDSTVEEIEELYNGCDKRLRKAKKKGIIKWVLMLGWIPLVFIVVIVSLLISEPGQEKAENDRLENIVIDVQNALEDGEYKYALSIADTIDYQRYDIEMERKWDIQREYWVDKVLTEASQNGVELEYVYTPDIDKAN